MAVVGGAGGCGCRDGVDLAAGGGEGVGAGGLPAGGLFGVVVSFAEALAVA